MRTLLICLLLTGCASNQSCDDLACITRKARHEAYIDCLAQHRKMQSDFIILSNAGLNVDPGIIIDACHEVARRRVP